jgi:hypothetical protein
LLDFPEKSTGDGILGSNPTLRSSAPDLAQSGFLPQRPGTIRIRVLLFHIGVLVLPGKALGLALCEDDQVVELGVDILAMDVQQLARGPPDIPVHELGQKKEY